MASLEDLSVIEMSDALVFDMREPGVGDVDVPLFHGNSPGAGLHLVTLPADPDKAGSL